MVVIGKKDFNIIVDNFKKDSIKNSNSVVDMLKLLEEKESKRVVGAITALHKIFSFIWKKYFITKPPVVPANLQNNEQQYQVWICKRYEEFVQRLLSLLSTSSKPVKEMALHSYVRLLKQEAVKMREDDPDFRVFPTQSLQSLVCVFLANDLSNKRIIGFMEEYLECHDLAFYTVKALLAALEEKSVSEVSETFVSNLFSVLQMISIPGEKDSPKLFTYMGENSADDKKISEYKFPHTTFHNNLSKLWVRTIQVPLTPHLYRQSLILLGDKFLVYMKDPLRFTDFFVESYKIGGVISLLSLQGIFYLITKCDLEYPDFYAKLYALVDPMIFHVKYKTRFFLLCDQFLSSTHLPEYIIAAFMKRFAHLSLSAPSHSLLLVLKFIRNLIIRYPSLVKLVHNTEIKDAVVDPFNPDEEDLSKCNACLSSLWEFECLQKHVWPSISKSASFTHKKTSGLEDSIAPCLKDHYTEIFKRSCKSKMKDVPLTFHEPVGLFSYVDDNMSSVWSLS